MGADCRQMKGLAGLNTAQYMPEQRRIFEGTRLLLKYFMDFSRMR
jgi:hypothetical protein